MMLIFCSLLFSGKFMMIKKRLYQAFAVSVLLISMTALADSGLNLTITRVASTFKIDANAFSGLTPPAYNNGVYAFIGQGHGATELGIFANPNGYLQDIVTNKTIIPNSSASFSSFGGTTSNDQLHRLISINSKGDIVFFGEGSFTLQGLYEYKNRKMLLIANDKTPIPGANGDFSSYAYPDILADSSVGFWGESGNSQQGVYFANPQGLLHKLIDTQTHVPLGQGNFVDISNVSFSSLSTEKSPEFAFIGKGVNKQLGLYLYSYGKTRLIANENTPLPNQGTGYFTNFAKLSFDANTGGIAYIAGGLLGQNGIYYWDGKQTTQIANIQSFIPNGIGHFLHFSQVDASGNLLAFQGSGQSGQQGVYIYSSSGSIYKILNNHDTLDDRKIVSVMISGNSLHGDNLALLVNFKDKSQAIYVITLGLAQNNA